MRIGISRLAGAGGARIIAGLPGEARRGPAGLLRQLGAGRPAAVAIGLAAMPETTRSSRPVDAARRRTRRNLPVLAGALLAIAAMTTLVSYSVTLYRLFCAATGYNGTTRRVASDAAARAAETVTVRFNTDIAPGLPWRFEPAQGEVTVHFGDQALVYFKATNLSDRPLVGHAAYNVEPDAVGRYFNKIQCFCFTEERLAPHQSVEMPVVFFVDPAMLKDPDAGYIRSITLSYTFFASVRPAEASDLGRFAAPIPPGPTADPLRGHQLFAQRCAGCHAPSRNGAGPMLGGVLGRRAGSIAGYDYSPALRDAGLVWSPGNLERWLAGPKAFIPGSKMPVHVGESFDRRDLIAYLAALGEEIQAGATP
jgi:cytochrome c oxidase assembly protein subunit 11